MKIGIPKEIKDKEFRVALTPGWVQVLSRAGHDVYVETGAGVGSRFTDERYKEAGAKIVASAADAWSCEMVVKVKEPLPPEHHYLRPDLLLFTYLHLAPLQELTSVLLKSRTKAVGYETVQLADGSLPLLMPMSEVAGRMSVQVGARYLEAENEGKGKLLGGVPGVKPAKVAIIGGGVVGINAARMALGVGAQVSVIELSIERMRYLDEVLHGNFMTIKSNPQNVAEAVRDADLVIGGVLVPGARAPRIVTRDMIMQMEPGSVLVDVAIDQGGCFETSEPTSHSNPTYQLNGVIHYCVTNMPGAVPQTSTVALSNATFPYVFKLATLGLRRAVETDAALAAGVNTVDGLLTCRQVAEAQGLEYVPLEKCLAALAN
jgi:alanine dehydrogenase